MSPTAPTGPLAGRTRWMSSERRRRRDRGLSASASFRSNLVREEDGAGRKRRRLQGRPKWTGSPVYAGLVGKSGRGPLDAALLRCSRTPCCCAWKMTRREGRDCVRTGQLRCSMHEGRLTSAKSSFPPPYHRPARPARAPPLDPARSAAPSPMMASSSPSLPPPSPLLLGS